MITRFHHRTHQAILAGFVLILILVGFPAHAQEENADSQEENDQPPVEAAAGPARQTLVEKKISFNTEESHIADDLEVIEILWDFGDGVRTTGQQVSHSYAAPGRYLVRLTIATAAGISEDTAEVTVFDHVIVLLADNSASDEQLELARQQAASEEILLLTLKARSGGPEAIIEEELTQQLLNAREEITQSKLLVAWTEGSVGPNVFSKFSQQLRQADEITDTALDLDSKGVIILSATPLGVLSPTAQTAFDQLQPAYLLLTKPEALSLLLTATTAEETRQTIIGSPFEYRLIGTFSSRALSDIGLTNFVSFGINYLVNSGVPINNILLILMIPVIATILAFARQVIGIKAFGLITPTMTTLSFLVMGLTAGVIVFIVVLISGSLTRLILRRLRLLYLPRMALVLTSASLAILVMLGIGAATGNTTTLSFSIFPILILAVLAEEFIAVQFSQGARTALRITAWTLILVIICYLIVSWQLLRTFLLSYPETILLAIPINIILGRFAGLRLVEYLRFRELLRYGPPSQ